MTVIIMTVKVKISTIAITKIGRKKFLSRLFSFCHFFNFQNFSGQNLFLLGLDQERTVKVT